MVDRLNRALPESVPVSSLRRANHVPDKIAFGWASTVDDGMDKLKLRSSCVYGAGCPATDDSLSLVIIDFSRTFAAFSEALKPRAVERHNTTGPDGRDRRT